MSFVESLKKLVDPIAARREEQRREAAREQAKAQSDGEPPRFVCRICNISAEAETYCPECLAPTMVPVRD